MALLAYGLPFQLSSVGLESWLWPLSEAFLSMLLRDWRSRSTSKCFSDESSSIPTGLHVSKLKGRQEKESDQRERTWSLNVSTEHRNKQQINICTHTCGMVVLKISSIQLHVSSQTSGLNFSPLDITKFSKQLVPDRANCSLSAK